MFFRTSFLVCAVLPGVACGQLVITEINSNNGGSDFWELTNFGEELVDLGGYRWIDDKADPMDPSAQVIPLGTKLAPGESVVFVSSGSAATFRANWGLAASVKILTGGAGLGSNDQVHLFDSGNALVTSLSYAAGGFIRSGGSAATGGHAGVSAGGSAAQSLIYDPTYGPVNARYTVALGGNLGSWSVGAPVNGAGSPGTIGTAGGNTPPVFSGADQVYWRQGTALSTAAIRVKAQDLDPGQTVTLSVVASPEWLSFQNSALGEYRLAGTPAVAGDYSFTIRATDNGTPAMSTEQTYQLTVLHANSPIILNEYNGVGRDRYLRGGSATQDEQGVSPGPQDTHFGRVLGNGGEWVELVVVGNDTAGSVTDMRGWSIQVLSSEGQKTITLSQDPYWSQVVAGTILTFTVDDSAAGGLDTALHRVSSLHDQGYVWSNIWLGDAAMIDLASSQLGAPLGIGANDTRFVISNSSGVRVYGPAGEGVAMKDSSLAGSEIGVSDREMMRLEADPMKSVDPLFGKYDDGDTSSTFGAPNSWGSAGDQQHFAGFKLANSPPRFESSPVKVAYGSYHYAISTSDPNGQAVTVSALEMPSFLSLAVGPSGTASLTTNRPLTLADAGEHLIVLKAADGASVAGVTTQSFVLTVFNDSPTVIVNEYNAVAPHKFLNGGDLFSDDDGGEVSVDAHFGRVLGNGGRWVELVVVGDGGPSSVDLRGWTLEIGTSVGGRFLVSNRLTLSQDQAWQAVAAGTILTFIDRTTAWGGMDSERLRRDQIATTGSAWTNVWMGDSQLLDQSDVDGRGYSISGGVVSPIEIHHNHTQFRLRDAADRVVFGPVGEGIGESVGTSSTEIFELEDHPGTHVSPLVWATLTEPGYDDGASGSTFGWPNRWHEGDGGEETEQQFGAFIPMQNPYQTWLGQYSLKGSQAEPSADPDLDGRSNLHEYAFGGNPTVSDVAPPGSIIRTAEGVRWRFLQRTDDHRLDVSYKVSTDLLNWAGLPAERISVSHQPHGEGYEWIEVSVSAADHAREFFRTEVRIDP